MLPWDHIDPLVRRAYLEAEQQKALRGETTPDCRLGCTGCGMNQYTECFKNADRSSAVFAGTAAGE